MKPTENTEMLPREQWQNCHRCENTGWRSSDDNEVKCECRSDTKSTFVQKRIWIKSFKDLPGGIVLGHLSYEEYDAIKALRGTFLHKLDECPAKAVMPEPEEEKKHFIVGRALHDYVLLGKEGFDKRFLVAGICSAVLKSGKNQGQQCGKPGKEYHGDDFWMCGQHAEGIAQPDKAIVSGEDFDHIMGMKESILNHPTARRFMTQGQPEQGIVWKDETTEEWCKVLVDWLPDKAAGCLLNLKSTRSANKWAFNRQINTLGYAMSAAMSLEGASIATGEQYEYFGFIVVEKEPPYQCEVYQLDESWINVGSAAFHRLVGVAKDCRQKYEEHIKTHSHEEALARAYPAHKYAGSEVLIAPGFIGED